MGNEILAIVPARGGSKSIPHKNIIDLCGKPLIQWTLDEVEKLKDKVDTIVSTDDEKIKSVVEGLGFKVVDRPPHLATDESLIIDTLEYILNLDEYKKYKYLMLLEPTAPLRTVKDIEKCIDKIIKEQLDSVATFTEASLNPHRAWKISGDGKVKLFIDEAIPWLPRQKLPKAYQLNGLVYIAEVTYLLKNKQLFGGNSAAILSDAERSIDIDDFSDLYIAEYLLKEKREKDAKLK